MKRESWVGSMGEKNETRMLEMLVGFCFRLEGKRGMCSNKVTQVQQPSGFLWFMAVMDTCSGALRACSVLHQEYSTLWIQFSLPWYLVELPDPTFSGLDLNALICHVVTCSSPISIFFKELWQLLGEMAQKKLPKNQRIKCPRPEIHEPFVFWNSSGSFLTGFQLRAPFLVGEDNYINAVSSLCILV